MKKITKILCLLSIALISILLCACGTKKEKKETGVKLSAPEIITKVVEKLDNFPEHETLKKGDEDDQKWFEYLCEFDYDKVEDYVIKYSVSGEADELLIIKVKDEADIKSLKDALSKRQESRKNQFQQYAAEEVAKIDAAQIVAKENVVAFIVSDDVSNISNMFKETLDENK